MRLRGFSIVETLVSLLLIAICLAAGLRFATRLRPPHTEAIAPERLTHADLVRFLEPRDAVLASERGLLIATERDRAYPGLTRVSLASEGATAPPVELLIYRP